MGKQPRQQIFRKAALDRLASPDQLDRPISLVRPSAWMLLLVVFAGVVAGISWTSLARAPIRVAGKGILINQAGLAEIVATTEGSLKSLDIKVGDVVELNQVVATVSKAELQREIAGAVAELADATLRYDELTTFYGEQAKRDAVASEERFKTIANTRDLLNERKALLEEKLRSVKDLVKQKVVLRDRLIDAQLALSNARERLSTLDEEVISIKLKTAEKQSVRYLALLDKRLASEDLKRKISRLSARLSSQKIIRASQAGRIVEIKVNPGEVVKPGTALATLAPLEVQDGLIALLFMTPEKGKRVEPGMAVQIAPSTVRVQEYGFILGEVKSVSPLPVTPEGMRRILQNDQLVKQLSSSGAPIEIRVALKRNKSTTSGFTWSSSQGPPQPINSGTLLSGDVVIRKVRVLELIVPGISRFGDASAVFD